MVSKPMAIILLRDGTTMSYNTSIIHLFKNRGVYTQITTGHKNSKLEHNVLSHLTYHTSKIAVSLLS
jgi:hypothetical protein